MIDTQEKLSPLALGFARILAGVAKPVHRRPAAVPKSSHRSILATSAAAIKAAAGT